MNLACRTIASLVIVIFSCTALEAAHANESVPTPSTFTLLQVNVTQDQEAPPPPALRDLAAKPVTTQGATARELDETPAYKKWWFWALTAVVVGGTVALGKWAAKPTTQPAHSCAPGTVACFGDGRPK